MADGHRADGRGQRPRARARDVDGRADGDRASARPTWPRKASTCVARCAHVPACRRASAAPPSALVTLGDLRLRAGCGAAAAPGAGGTRGRSPRASSRATAEATPCCWAAAARIPRRLLSARCCTRGGSRSGPTCPGMFSANPRQVAGARLLKRARLRRSAGNRHAPAPRCCTRAASCRCAQCAIPLLGARHQRPDLAGTTSAALRGRRGRAASRRSARKKGITLVSMESSACGSRSASWPTCSRSSSATGCRSTWFDLRDQRHRVARPERQPARRRRALEALCADSRALCRVKVIAPCAAVTLVGRGMRAHPAPARRRRSSCSRSSSVHLVSQAANDLNLTFVVDEDQGDRLVSAAARPADRAASQPSDDEVLGPTWERSVRDQRGRARAARRGGGAVATSCWRIAQAHGCAYVYDAATRSSATARRLLRDRRVWIAVLRDQGQPASGHPAHAGRAGFGFECVSRGELRARAASRAAGHRPGPDPVHAQLRAARRVRVGLAQGVRVTRRQPLHPARLAASCSAAARCCVRIDTGHRPRPPRQRAYRRACTRSSACRWSSWTNSTACARGR